MGVGVSTTVHLFLNIRVERFFSLSTFYPNLKAQRVVMKISTPMPVRTKSTLLKLAPLMRVIFMIVFFFLAI
jgi:hypothetical protein